jgi:hypothetical protein
MPFARRVLTSPERRRVAMGAPGADCLPRLRPTPGPAGVMVVTFRPGMPNLCPGCHGTHWHVGRAMAECACCGAALPIATDRPGWARVG